MSPVTDLEDPRGVKGFDGTILDGSPVTVAVPARDEARHLPRLFAALASQRGVPRFTLSLLLDQCRDESRAVAAQLARVASFAVNVHVRDGQGPGNVGQARAEACARAVGDVANGILLTTDADSVPAPGWIAANVAALARADIVAGRIVCRRGTSPEHDRLAAYYDRLHGLRRTIDPVPWEDTTTHHWTSGASLGMRAATYRAVGGFAPATSGEDAALVDRAHRIGLRVRRDARVVVRTSARRRGRAAAGFASLLSLLDGYDQTVVVAHPDDEAWRYRRHALLRRDPSLAKRPETAEILGIDPTDLARVAAETACGEALGGRLVGAPPGGMRRVPLATAEIALDALVAPLLTGAA